jgi:tetratricopeptide (TPR) repeat protein
VLARADELRQAGRLDEAEETCSAALTRNPDNAELFHALGIIAMEQQRFGDAIVFLRRAVALVPESAFTHVNLACALVEREKFEEAIRAAKKAIKLEPAAVSPYLVMGGTYSRMGDHEAAISAFREGLDAQPDHAGCLISLGHSLKTIGRRDEAIAVYRRAIARYPDLGDAYWSLANLKAFHFTSAEVAAIEAHVDDEHLSEETRIKFLFALGKAFEDQSRYRRAFKCFQRGNTARRQHEFYDSVQAQDMNDRIMEVLDKRLLAHSVDVAKDAPTPIFIVGLPRSGSTLIEQILASHSQVEGTKELPELERLIGSMNREHRSGLVYPELLREIRSDDRTALARRYLDATQRYRTDRPYFTDKMPNNFRHIGLIRLLFPKGRVIDARRHPLDSCLGSYKQLFIKGQPFTYDLFELGEYYLEYRRLMDHWNTLLPGYIHEVQYETMVSEPEVQIRRLLAYCGLSWEDACLDFHETNRAIDSASSEQVRQPIYTSSMHNWRDYERDLAPLIETLRPVLEELPEELRPATLNQQ